MFQNPSFHSICVCQNQLLLWLVCVAWVHWHGWTERWNGSPAVPAESRLASWRLGGGDETPLCVKPRAPFSSLRNYDTRALWSANGWAALLQRPIALHYAQRASRSPRIWLAHRADHPTNRNRLSAWCGIVPFCNTPWINPPTKPIPVSHHIRINITAVYALLIPEISLFVHNGICCVWITNTLRRRALRVRGGRSERLSVETRRHVMAAESRRKSERWLTLLFVCSMQRWMLRAGQMPRCRAPTRARSNVWQSPGGLMETLDSRGVCELWANRFASTTDLYGIKQP